MHDIFISYDDAEIQRVLPVVTALEAQGWSVFWDRKTPVGLTWMQFLASEIQACRAVVVLWSNTSVNSPWVLEEAETGKRAGKLFPVTIDPVLPPFGFSSIQAANMVGWTGDPAAPQFQDMVMQLTRLLGPPAPPRGVLDERKRRRAAAHHVPASPSPQAEAPSGPQAAAPVTLPPQPPHAQPLTHDIKNKRTLPVDGRSMCKRRAIGLGALVWVIADLMQRASVWAFVSSNGMLYVDPDLVLVTLAYAFRALAGAISLVMVLRCFKPSAAPIDWVRGGAAWVGGLLVGDALYHVIDMMLSGDTVALPPWWLHMLRGAAIGCVAGLLTVMALRQAGAQVESRLANAAIGAWTIAFGVVYGLGELLLGAIRETYYLNDQYGLSLALPTGLGWAAGAWLLLRPARRSE